MGLLERFQRGRRGSEPADVPAATTAPAPSEPVVEEPAAPADGPPSAPEPVIEEHPVDEGRQRLGVWLDVSADDLAGLHDAIEQIYDGTLDGVTIRGVFTPEVMAAGVERVRGYADEFRDHGKQIMFGTALVGADDDRSDYYGGAPTINDRIGGLFDVDFVARIGEVLSACGGSRPAVVPEEAGRGRYVPATIRLLPPDRGVMHAHTANEFCDVWGAYSHLREIARMRDSLSYFVVGQAPEAGGQLELYDLMWDDTPDDVLARSMSEERDALLERFGTRLTDVGAGDMILFTGGRIWHRVTPVEGDRERVTIGGFVALSQDDRTVYYWS